MKKTRLIIAALAAFTLVGTMPVQAESATNKAKKQFKESVSRLKNCFRGKCTRWEALKLARDVAITAAAVITAIYGIGEGFRRGSIAARARGYISMPTAAKVYKTGQQLQRPGAPFVRAGKEAYRGGVRAVEAAQEASIRAQ